MQLELELKGKAVLRGQDHYWSAIRALGSAQEIFQAKDVLGASNRGSGQHINEFLKKLVRGGYVEKVDGGYRLLRRPMLVPSLRADGTPAPGGLCQQQVWNALRSIGDWASTEEIAFVASTEDVPVPRPTASQYLAHLERAGYLLGKRTRTKSWRLKPAMNSGPQAPIIIRARAVYDRNSGNLVGPIAAEEVA